MQLEPPWLFQLPGNPRSAYAGRDAGSLDLYTSRVPPRLHSQPDIWAWREEKNEMLLNPCLDVKVSKVYFYSTIHYKLFT